MKIIPYISREKVENKVKELLIEYNKLGRGRRAAKIGDLGWICTIYEKKCNIIRTDALDLLNKLPQTELWNFYQDICNKVVVK